MNSITAPQVVSELGSDMCDKRSAAIAAGAQERLEVLASTVPSMPLEPEARHRVQVVGVSRTWKDVLLLVERVASTDTTVLLTGESGTGKEVIANLIHRSSLRAGKRMVAINCAALPEELLESELFGHERGAFTGALATKIGRIEQAAGGTLFLDEIGEMSPRVQAKFLRVLAEREFQRLGGTRTLRADVRVIAATNRDLVAGSARQDFRSDLYYRLNVFGIHIPPLRARPDDILKLAEAFLEELGRTMGRAPTRISADARECLLAYSWPGNVRELRNVIERAILYCDGGPITRAHLPVAVTRAGAGPILRVNSSTQTRDSSLPESLNLDAVERGLVENAIRTARGNKSQAARLLGLSRSQLYSRLEKHGLG